MQKQYFTGFRQLTNKQIEHDTGGGFANYVLVINVIFA